MAVNKDLAWAGALSSGLSLPHPGDPTHDPGDWLGHKVTAINSILSGKSSHQTYVLFSLPPTPCASTTPGTPHWFLCFNPGAAKVSTTHPTEWHRLQNWLLAGVYSDETEPKATLPREQLLKGVLQGCTPPGTSAIHREARKTQLVSINASQHRNKGFAGAPTSPLTKRSCGCPLMSPVPLSPQATCRGMEK